MFGEQWLAIRYGSKCGNITLDCSTIVFGFGNRNRKVKPMEQFSQYLPGILLAYGVTLVALASPGPNILAVMGTSMNEGRTSGLALGFGVALGSFCWAVLTILGLTALLAAYAPALTIIKIAGGLYLLYLASKAFRAAASEQDMTAKTLSGGKRSLFEYGLRGFLIQMTNPKALLAWIATISLGLQAGAPFWVGAAIVLGTFAMSLVIHALYAVAFSTPIMVRLYAKARRGIQATLGTFFAFAGIKLLLSRS